jgi:hypothetical protein
MILAEPQVKGKQSTEPEQNPHLGFVIAAICTVASLILFFGWEAFGNETALKRNSLENSCCCSFIYWIVWLRK